MTVRLTRSIAAALLLVGALSLSTLGTTAHAEDERDQLFRKNGTKMAVYVETETTASIGYRTLKAGPGGQPANQLKLNEFDRVVYVGMDGGAWKKGVTEREAGNFETAAEYFNQHATTGQREWEKVYGSMAEGECWELAHKYPDAAKAFAVIVTGFAGNPTSTPPVLPNRQWLDAKYRYGMALAQAKDPLAAKLADEMEAQGKKESNSSFESRANAIRAAIAGLDGNAGKFTEFMKKATLRSFEEKEVWFHFKLFCAETLRTSLKKPKDAASIYREILTGLGADPARSAQISLGLGLTLVETDKSAALIELLKLDLMPYGSPDQKCEARYNAGRLQWDEAQTIKANSDAMKDQKKADFVKELERSARLLVSAAADGPPKNPTVDLAKALLTSFGPDPDAPKDAPKTAAPTADAPAPTPAPAPAPKPAPKPKPK